MRLLEPLHRQRIATKVGEHKSGRTLDRCFYADEAVYQAELNAFWRSGWLFAGHTCQVAEPGDYFVYKVAGDEILILRDDEGHIRATHNVCRHRGSTLCQEPAGHVGRIVCPYHQWTYGRDGQLLACRGMGEDFDKSQYRLKPVQLEEVGGLIFVSLAEEPIPFDAARAEMAPQLAPQGFDRAKVAKIVDYTIPANWKLVWENNRECYHCNANHPQYIKANFDHFNADDTTQRVRTAITSATAKQEDRWAAQGLAATHTATGMCVFPDAANKIWFAANRTPLVDGYVSETMDGRQVAPLMGDYQAPDVGTLRMRTLPNFWNHSSCDHGVSTRLTPLGHFATEARVIWLVDRDAKEGVDYRLDEIMPFWQLTSEQDWELCELAQRGVTSSGYQPGPLSPVKEYNVMGFLKWYLDVLGDWAGKTPGAVD
ncbi:MAG: aromatic ring-hydroxylating dioxygenase subunit alpha [Planctomycetia bacterium]|nr:aromatic ring-hydroxylating dioxygenase subunit alpha [Planctomycetia bacterium]